MFRSLILYILSSVNEVICHGIPDQRKLQEGDIINIGEFSFTIYTFSADSTYEDVTLYYDGMNTELACKNINYLLTSRGY